MFKFFWKLSKIFAKTFIKFIQKVFIHFLKTPSSFFSKISIFFFYKCYPGFSNFFNSSKFLQSFRKIIAKLFGIPKFYQKLQNTNFPIINPKFFQNFLNNNYSIISAESLQQNRKFPWNFIKVFQQLYKMTLKCFSNFIKITRLPQGCTEKIIWRKGSLKI